MSKPAPPQGVRRVVGKASLAKGSICGLALSIAAEAEALGFQVAKHRASLGGGHSSSRYLELTDRQARKWCLRVSDHFRPRSSPHAPPHFDLVSLDRGSGLGEARAFLIAIVADTAPWFHRRAQRQRRSRRRLPSGRRGG